VSPADRANSRRRQPRRRSSAGTAAEGKTPLTKNSGSKGSAAKSKPRMRTVRETSAGGLVVDGLDGPRDQLCAALIGRTDRRGRLLWSLPKGHIEEGETAEQTAIREVAEETGIRGTVVAELGSIDYWFVTDGRRVHKTVHHYLMRSIGGELSDADVEVTKVAWVPLSELDSRLAYADERRLAEVANRLIDRMENGRR
jgi:8-oxo-dGTP pyrophosphatase MutT (NUDIX family)